MKSNSKKFRFFEITEFMPSKDLDGKLASKLINTISQNLSFKA